MPGNHDVFFDAFISSIEKIEIPSDVKEKSKLVQQLSVPNSTLRWSWKELCFYRIIDPELYLSRFDNFCSMYSRFYNGQRSYSKNPEDQFDVFDFSELNFSILALNSCYNNDPLHRSGDFHPSVLTKACHTALAVDRRGWLIASAWHHNLAGSPNQDAYLDPDFVQLLIDSGVSLSFHGHQHLAECFDERYRLGPAQRKMTVISAGTLCSEPKNLQPGEPRSYNIVEVLSNRSVGRVHQRMMTNMIFNLPLWGPGYFTSTNSSYFDFTICPPLLERTVEINLEVLLAKAENFIGEKKWHDALEILINLNDKPIGRPLLLKALSEIDDSSLILSTLWPPQTITEVIMVADALINMKQIEKIAEFLNLEIVKNNTDASVASILQKVKQRIR